MLKRIDPLIQPYRPKLEYPIEKVNGLFNLINNMDTQQIKQYAIVNSISLNVDEPSTGENLIHKVLNSNNANKKEFHRLNVIKFLVQNEVNPDKPNKENTTPLHLACKKQYFSIVEYLVDLGVDGNFRDNNGFTPLHYALQGKIELYLETKEVKEFIPKPKKISFEKNDKLIELKKNIWELIKNSDILEVFSKTLNNSIFSDSKIKSLTNDLIEAISKNILENKQDSIKFYKDNIKLLKNEIGNIVNKKWQNFPELGELVIHEKESDSWNIDGNTKSPLKNINIEDNIKKEVKNCKEAIKNICNSFTYTYMKGDEYNMEIEYKQQIKEIFKIFLKGGYVPFNEVNIPATGTSQATKEYRLQGNINDYKDKWEKFNDSQMSAKSVDYADNIIDWENQTFLGGSRQMYISLSSIADLEKLLSYRTIEEKVFHILTLCDSNNYIENFNSNDIFQSITNNKQTFEDYLVNNKNLVKLCYNKIFKKELNLSLDKFSNKNISSVIYCLYCSYYCYDSDTNLDGTIPDLICALVSALNYGDGTITNEALDASLKKYFISHIVKTKDLDAKLKGLINVLLSEKLSGDINSYNNKDPEISNKVKELTNYIRNIDRSKEEKINKMNELILLIYDKINKMEFKPHEYDTFSVISFINNGLEIKEDRNFLILEEFDILKEKHDEKYNDEEIINKIIYLMRKRQHISLVSYLNHIFEFYTFPGDENVKRIIQNLSMNKLLEARHLGLFYLGLIPNYYAHSFDEARKINLKIENENPKFHKIVFTDNRDFFDFVADEMNDNQIPLIGNYIYIQTNLSQKQKDNYYLYDEFNYRPPLSFVENLIKKRNLFVLKKILTILTKESYFNNSLVNLIQSNTQLSKVFIKIYPTLVVLAEMMKYYGDTENFDRIDKIIGNLNKYNGYILLYHYLVSPDKMFKLPKFNYYEIPALEKTSKFLYYDGSDLNFKKEDANASVVSRETNIEEIKNDMHIYNYGFTNYKSLINNIRDKMLRGKYIIKKEDLILSKSKRLPPAIVSILPEFYKFNLHKVIINVFNDIKNNPNIITNNILSIIKELKKDILEEDVSAYLTIGKIIQELVSQQSKIYLDRQTNYLISEVLRRKINLPSDIKDEIIGDFKPIEYEVMLNTVKLTDEDLTDLDKIPYNLYQFSKVDFMKEKDDNIKEFIIYPEEYANSELLKSKYKLNIDYKILEKLLNQSVNPYLVDVNNQNPLFPVLKMHEYDIISKLKTVIDFRELSEFKAFDFLIDEFENHSYKIKNKSAKFKDWLDYFVSYQKEEVIGLILGNENFGNNIPRYLENSFSVICYITNQYLSESIYKMEDIDFDKLKSLLFDEYEIFFNLAIDKKNYTSYLFVNKNVDSIKDIFEKDEDNYVMDFIETKKNELKKLEKTGEKLNPGNTKNRINKDIEKLNEEITIIYSLIVNKINFTNKSLNENKILDRYQKLTDEKGTLSKILSKMVTLDKLESSNDLITFQILKKEPTIINNLKKSNNLEDFKKIFDFYDHTNKVSEIYFTFGKYTENNKALLFVKELLIFMTKYFIIFPYMMLLRKILLEYFRNTNPNLKTSDINKRINYCFQKSSFFGDKESNIEKILYDDISKTFVENSSFIFENSFKEAEFNQQSVRDLLDGVTNLLTFNDIVPIPEDSIFYKNIKEVNNYFETFTNKLILNWQVIIENTFKFNINQGKIIKSIYNLLQTPTEITPK